MDEAHLADAGQAILPWKNQLKISWSGPKSSSSCLIRSTEDRAVLGESDDRTERQAKKRDNYIVLKTTVCRQISRRSSGSDGGQTRDQANPHDTKGYEINIFDTPAQLQEEIQNRSENPGTSLQGSSPP